ncbi:hypothetical protein GGR53DRAFT_477569 [Hypoxylon sp. FL1150]|nr:hypothetical protein GGR53DRAFT_477569 [Hypoxylon sp. FL1150]
MISTRNIPEGAVHGSQAVTRAPNSHVVSKPIPESQSQDPRKYQLNQMKKRYSPKQNTLQDGTTNLQFQLKPSDPDFPFELEYLECELQVPASYPEKVPVLRVKNKDIPRGFAVNIERGWMKLVQENQTSTLLALTNALDKNLEAFLSERKTETVTLLSFKDTRHIDSSASVLGETSSPKDQAPPKLKAAPETRKPYIPEESFTEQEICAARARRPQEIRQLEARMSRMPHYQKSADGVVYTLPLEPRRRAELPVALQRVQSVQLIIPLLYPLQPLKVLLNDVESKDAEALEEIFAARTAQLKQISLTSHMNYLAQNIHMMAKQAAAARKQAEIPQPQDTSRDTTGNEYQEASASVAAGEEGKSHIHVIPRPPEWGFGDESGESSDSDDSDDWDSEDESDDGGAAIDMGSGSISSGMAQTVERGTAMSFPTIELHGIELLQVAILNLSVKCERCRTFNDITGLRPAEAEKQSSCKKCATAFTAAFRREFVHQNSVRAGFIDVSGCTVNDMLPRCLPPLLIQPTSSGTYLPMYLNTC